MFQLIKRVLIAACITVACLLVAFLLFLYVLGHPVRGQYFDSDGVRIHYTVQGQGVPIILVHGFALNSDINWRFPGTIGLLARTNKVIAMDARGHGLSGTPHDPQAYGAEMAEDVIRLMDHLGISRAHVAGYSMGGFIAMKLLATHPDRLISVIPCGAGLMTPDSSDAHLMERIVPSLRDNGTMTELIEMLRPEGERATFLHKISENGMIRFLNDTEALADVAAQFYQLSVSAEQLRGNRVPVLFIVGDRDPIKKAVDDLGGIMPNRHEIVVAGGTHASTICRRELREGIAEFIVANTPQ